MEYGWTLSEDHGEDRETAVRLRNPAARNDFVGGIDNEALDFCQLEDFINNDDEGENAYFVDTLGQEPVRNNSSAEATPIVVVERAPAPGDGSTRTSNLHNRSTRLPQQSQPNQAYTQTHNLPESPPDSGSEPPYSPQQEGLGDKHNAHSKYGPTQDILLHSSHPSLYPSHLPLKPSSHLPPCESMLIQHPVLTPLLNRNEAILLSRNDAAAILLNSSGVDVEPKSPLNVAALDISSAPILIGGSPQQQATGVIGGPAASPNTAASMTLSRNGFESNDADSSVATMYTSLQAKKRKLSQDSGAPIMFVKQEKPDPSLELSPDSNSSPGGQQEDYNDDGSVYVDSSYQCIRFQPFQQTQWHVMCDQNLKEVPLPHYRVDADKGFNFSNADEAFVCQKKNHFQITCHTQLLGDPQFIKTPEGVKKISAFYLHFYGVKVESPTQTIKVEQSQSDRSKKPFHPVLIELQGDQVTKVTVGRLHFSETTSNNMRKKGKPNPDQRYFYLVVGLHAHTGDSNYQIISHASERIIVRASNPGQFESDVELCWQKGQTSESIYHSGRVGINTDRPDECLVVHGNLKVTGHIVQPSDLRAKLHLQECNTSDQLKNIEQIRVVKYRYADEFADKLGIKEDTGVIAQEIQHILPDAVRAGGDLNLPNGEVIQNFLVVNKDRIFMENVGAVKELCKVTDNLGKRIEQVEKMNKKLAKLRKGDSFKSTSSSSTVSSYVPPVHIHYGNKSGQKSKKLPAKSFAPSAWVCSNRIIHIAIGVLVLVMALCLAAMATLYILQSQQTKRQQQQIMQLKSVLPTAQHNLRAMPMKRPLFSTTLSNLLDSNRTHYPSILTKIQQHLKSTKLIPLVKSTLETPLVDRMARVPSTCLGQPLHCTDTSDKEDREPDKPPCQSYCCFGDIRGYELLHSSNSQLTSMIHDITQFEAFDEKSSLMSHSDKRIEVPENAPPSASNTIEHGPKNLKLVNRENSDRIGRSRREPESFTDHNSVADHNGVIITLNGENINATVGPEFCALFLNDYTLCLDRAAANFTYYIPISKFFMGSTILLEIRFQKNKRNISEVVVCERKATPTACTRTKHPPEIGKPTSPYAFPIDLWNFSSTAFKLRVPFTHSPPDICRLTKQELGLSFLEYNFNIYRACEE